MKEPTDEQLMAYADGELGPEEARQIAEILARRPDLARRVAAYRQTGRGLGELFPAPADVPANDPLARAILAHPLASERGAGGKPTPASDKVAPDQNLSKTAAASFRTQTTSQSAGNVPAIKPSPSASGAGLSNGSVPPNGAKVIPFAPRPKAEPRKAPVRSPFAIAATIALLVASGVALKMYGDSLKSPRVELAKAPAAQVGVPIAQLAEALERTPSRQAATISADGWNVTPALTFSSHDGRICREYMATKAQLARSGVACRETSGTWSLQAEGPTAVDDGKALTKPAGRDTPESVDATVRRLMKGDPFGKDEEGETLKRGWKR